MVLLLQGRDVGVEVTGWQRQRGGRHPAARRPRLGVGIRRLHVRAVVEEVLGGEVPVRGFLPGHVVRGRDDGRVPGRGQAVARLLGSNVGAPMGVT